MIDFNKSELEILKFWHDKKIFEKLMKKNKGKRKWSFIDGPITANNPMGVHHAWGRTYKDVFQRFKAMQGFEQRFQNGFDCQGLWVEREEEKDLGLKDKKDIEKFGILNFVQACKKRVEKFSKIQTEQSIRLGQWMDWKNSYYTMSDNNNLHNWHLIKTYFKKGWLHKDKDAVPWCWRCGTASSKHDIATEGYKEVTHTALFMQFPLKEAPDEYFLVFTTTPWTIPANVALAVNPNINYVKVDNSGVLYWLAESRLNELVGNYKILEKKKGARLKGKEYIMPYSYLEQQQGAPHKIVLWNLASGEEGTGIVHVAPGCGPEDYDLGKKEYLPAISPLDEMGFYKEGFGELSLKKYSDINKAVLHDLEQRRFVYKISQIKHRYPHCWRCGSELVFRLVDEWYIHAKEIRSKLIKENKKITWFPEYGKKRQEEWFKNMGAWLISRKRYWGLPLPIWECSCGHVEVFGSLEELRKKAIDKNRVDKIPEIHRPWIDEIKIKCDKCGKEVSRITDVGDAWLDAGIVPFSTLNYLKDRDYWKQWYPADFISESMPGQFRGWFNAIMWSSVVLEGKSPFKTILGYETLKDEKGEEMHKSKGNAIWFNDAVEKIGADPMRFLYCLQDPTQDLRFGFNVVKEPKNNLNILYNINALLENYQQKISEKFNAIEDKWILSKLNSLIKKVTYELENLHPHLASRALQDFWLNDLSRGYIQLVRDRLAGDELEVKKIVVIIYIELLKLCAPIIPFLTEHIWQKLKNKINLKEESVHLCSWPKSESKKIDNKLEENFELALKIIEKGFAERDKEKIGLRWPLAEAIVSSPHELNPGLIEIIAKQMNVKKVTLKKIKENEIKVTLDIKITQKLEAEGFARELARKVQAERKKAGLKRGQPIELKIFLDDKLKSSLAHHANFIKERTNSLYIEFLDLEKAEKDKIETFTIKERKFAIKF
ncbi:isoleucine--tRNA ligase [Candidatus Pacearchaeota archaeon]|nr:isoleucine--tRNA ligase [Candidatus Pacearchaeota archaeon]